MSNHSKSDTMSPLLIATLGVHLKPQTQKEVETITVNTGDTKKEIRRAISPGGSHQELFDPPLEVLPNVKFSISVRYRGIRRSVATISLDPKAVLVEANEKDGRQVYSKTERKLQVTIGIQSLPSDINEDAASCSKFRVLIIGESGVGKSSLINKVFGISGLDVSNTTRGKADVDHELAAPKNERFVIHDSRGFEAADRCNLDLVCNFIASRRRMRELKDQLHAVWLCLEIPYAHARLMEAGVEKFLGEKRELLGNIPLIVVFTKLDSLVNMYHVDALVAEETLDEDDLEDRKQKAMETLCLAPVREVAGSESVPHVAVSTKKGYEDSLDVLVEETERTIQRYIKDDATRGVNMTTQRMSSLKLH